MKYMLTAGKFCKKREKLNFSQQDDKTIAEDLQKAITFKRNSNMQKTLATLTNYILSDELRTTGLLQKKNDTRILAKVQHIFWEWKNEGLINDFNDFEDATKSWIMAYAR